MDRTVFQKMNQQAAAEGVVMLKNEKNMLPIKKGETVAVYGRAQLEYYRSGTGSGGAVNVPYKTNLIDGFEEFQVQMDEELKRTYEEWIQSHPFDNGGGGWAAEPWYQEDMPLDGELVSKTAARTTKAIYIIGRTAGEDKDNQKAEGSYYLTQQEKRNLEVILAHHEQTAILLNVSNIMDMGWLEEIAGREHILAVLYIWQGGMDGGSAFGSVISGVESPSGKLPDTIAKRVEDYPSDTNFGNEIQNIYEEDIYVGYRYFETFAREKVLYPFGFGLTYTEFKMDFVKAEKKENSYNFCIKVTNVGSQYAAKEVVQLYYEAPQGRLGKPSRELGGFAKTKKLVPGESEEVEIEILLSDMASYDDSGCTGHRWAYVLEAGTYHFYLGENVRDAKLLADASFTIENTQVVQQLEEAGAPRQDFHILKPGECEGDTYKKEWISVATRTTDLRQRIQERLPKTIEFTGNQGITLQQVHNGEYDLDTFIAQLSKDELAMIVRGEGMSHPKVTKGTASALGGVSDSLIEYGIPLACCADGPSGLRMEAESVQLPIGTMLASTWNLDLVQKLYTLEGNLMVEHQVDTLLGPGLNIHRHPLNGRNFEYYSEDPYLTGTMASAVVKGLRVAGASGTVKHYACNGQESYRHRIEAVCSERALREIYLKGFEMAVKTKAVIALMTSYNPINGFWAASNYDLNTTILRGEWGYTGMVMTDWWAKMNDVQDGGEESDRKVADMVRSQNDVYMVVNNNGAEVNSNEDDTLEALEQGRLTLGELQQSAKNICRFILESPVILRKIESEEEVEEFASSEAPSCEIQSKKIEKGYQIAIGEAQTVGLFVEESGIYSIVAEISSQLTNLAQSTSRIYLNGKSMTTIQTNGTEGKWIVQKLQKIRLESGYYELKIEPVQTGLEIKRIEFWNKKNTPVKKMVHSK